MGTFEIIAAIALIVWSITTHEVAHAWVADKLGDGTAREEGRITLNPLPHIDPFMTIILPGALFLSSGMLLGGARPVPVFWPALRKPRRDMALVAAAGPVSNILIAFACAGLLAAFLRFGIWQPDSSGVAVLAIGVYGNIYLAVFNLMPIPPLDGSKIVGYFLRGEANRFWIQLEAFGFFGLLAVLFFARDLFYSIVWPPVLWLHKAVEAVFGVGYLSIETVMGLYN